MSGGGGAAVEAECLDLHTLRDLERRPAFLHHNHSQIAILNCFNSTTDLSMVRL